MDLTQVVTRRLNMPYHLQKRKDIYQLVPNSPRNQTRTSPHKKHPKKKRKFHIKDHPWLFLPVC